MQTCRPIEERPMRDFVIGLGSNLGAPSENLMRGAREICALPATELIALSRIYESEPVGPPQPRYLNAALRIRSELAPQSLLERLLEIERALGRVRTVRWGPRTLDLDLLWSAEPVRLPALEIPHPRLTERTFALAPLLDVSPELAARYQPLLNALGGPPRVRGRLARGAEGVYCECEPASLV
jgi:2-amino-4-hydroxy-6-hydroxymethyldihydropteridine diphosphokinase